VCLCLFWRIKREGALVYATDVDHVLMSMAVMTDERLDMYCSIASHI